MLAFLGALAESAVERWQSKILIVGEATVGRRGAGKGRQRGCRRALTALGEPARAVLRC